jgi:hypothetical protein
MVTMRRAVSLGLTFGLFVVCLVVSSHTPTLAQGAGEKKHPVIHKSIRELRAAHKNLKALKPHFDGHREKAMEHIDKAIVELHKAIKFVDGETKK